MIIWWILIIEIWCCEYSGHSWLLQYTLSSDNRCLWVISIKDKWGPQSTNVDVNADDEDEEEFDRLINEMESDAEDANDDDEDSDEAKKP
jgi:hypothetical protein